MGAQNLGRIRLEILDMPTMSIDLLERLTDPDDIKALLAHRRAQQPPPPPEPKRPDFIRQHSYPPTRKPRTTEGHLAVDGRKCCTMCGETKPVTNFYKRAASIDGLQQCCKPCQNQRRRPHFPPATVGNKLCYRCNQVKPVTDYEIDKQNSDGRKGVCKVCKRARAVVWYHRRGKHRHLAESIPGTHKRCSKCEQNLPLTDFNRNRCAPTGRDWYCRPCKQEFNQRYDKHRRKHEPLTEGMKHCGTCHSVKPVTDFSVRRLCRDGRQGMCKPCNRQYQRTRRARKP